MPFSVAVAVAVGSWQSFTLVSNLVSVIPMRLFSRSLIVALVTSVAGGIASAQQITTAGQPARLDVRVAGERSIRVTLRPLTFTDDFPFNPGVAERSYPAPA